MSTAIDFLRQFKFDGLLFIVFGDPESEDNWQFSRRLPVNAEMPKGVDAFFAPAMRKSKGNSKDNVLGSKRVWVDCDNAQYPEIVLPPTDEVWSGHGWHLYWELEEPITSVTTLEGLNKLLAYEIPTADRACWNANRLMRIPFTDNMKPPPAGVEWRKHRDVAYTPEDIRVWKRLPKRARQIIATGEVPEGKSRSERDWVAVRDLVSAGATDDLIELIFAFMPVGDKVRDPETHESYLKRTIEKARKAPAEAEDADQTSDDGPGGVDEDTGVARKGKKHRERVPLQVEERDDGYYVVGNTDRRVSTFTLRPKLLLDGSSFEQEDALICDVVAGTETWPDIVFPRGAFTNVARMFKELKNANWQWIGSDSDVRLLLPFIMQTVNDEGVPRVKATPAQGLHWVDGKPYFVGDRQTLSKDAVWSGYEAPIAWLPSSREHPRTELKPAVNASDLEMLRTSLPKLHNPSALWPILGWFAAAPLKTWLRDTKYSYRYPILHPTGTKGSGKTNLVQFCMALFGQRDVRSYDANTTRFVVLSLLSSNNGTPISFAEFRAAQVEQFQRYMLVSYDSGYDARGKGDQTTVSYPLHSPFVVDGEDMVTDAAVRERIVVARMRPADVTEGSEAWATYKSIEPRVTGKDSAAGPFGFGGYFIQQLLELLEERTELESLLEKARDAMHAAFPGTLPDRIRNNYTVTYLGILLLCRALDMEPPPAAVMAPSIRTVVDLDTGRSSTQADDFVESVVNAINVGTRINFKWEYDDEANQLWLNLRGAHDWWSERNARQQRSTLQRVAILNQLGEATYTLMDGGKPIIRNSTPMIGIDLAKAAETGLDIPIKLVKMRIDL